MPPDVPGPKTIHPGFLPAADLRTAALLVLIVLTSLAVGATTTLWLVPAYLVVMGWLLFAPGGSADVVAGDRETGPAACREESPAIAEEVVAEMTDGAAPGGEHAVVVTAPKTRKSRSKSGGKSKAKSAAPVPKTTATWVQVAPGKFIRVEVAEEPNIDGEAPSSDPAREGEPATTAESPHPSAVEPDAAMETIPQADAIPEETGDRELPAEIEVASQEIEAVTSYEPSPGDAPHAAEEPLPDSGDSEDVHRPSEPIPADDDLRPEGTSDEAISLDAPVDDHGPAFREGMGFDSGVGEPSGLGADVRIASTDLGPMMRGSPSGRRPIAGPERLFRLRREPRPKLRRATGRVGSSPRVSLSRM